MFWGFLKTVFNVFWGWECEFRHFLSPLIWSSDCRLIHWETLTPGLSLHSTCRRQLSVCWSLFLLCREKAASLLQETSQFPLNLEWSGPEAAWRQRFENSLVSMVRLRRWAQAGNLSTLPLSGRQHLWLCNYCESSCAHEDSWQKLLQSCMARRRVAKESAKGQNKYVSTEALCGCNIHQFLISGDRWAGRQSVMHGQMTPCDRIISRTNWGFLYEVPSVMSGLSVLFGEWQIAWHSKKSEKSTNAWWENLPLQVLHSFRKGETVFYSTCEQCLMQESLCFLMPSSKCCSTLFSSVFLFRGVKMLSLYHYCEVAFSAKQGWKKVLKLKQSFSCWKFIFKTWKKEKNLMLWFLTDIQILISGTSIVWDIKTWIVSSLSQTCYL